MIPRSSTGDACPLLAVYVLCVLQDARRARARAQCANAHDAGAAAGLSRALAAWPSLAVASLRGDAQRGTLAGVAAPHAACGCLTHCACRRQPRRCGPGHLCAPRPTHCTRAGDACSIGSLRRAMRVAEELGQSPLALKHKTLAHQRLGTPNALSRSRRTTCTPGHGHACENTPTSRIGCYWSIQTSTFTRSTRA